MHYDEGTSGTCLFFCTDSCGRFWGRTLDTSSHRISACQSDRMAYLVPVRTGPALSQVTPGPIAINAATFVGFQQAGIPGSIVSTLSIVIVPVLILCAVSCVLKKLEAEKSRKFKDMLRPIVAGLLTLSLVSPLTVTVKNGVMTMAMLVIGILIMRTCKFFKNYPPLLLVIYGIIGAVIFS